MISTKKVNINLKLMGKSVCSLSMSKMLHTFYKYTYVYIKVLKGLGCLLCPPTLTFLLMFM